MTSTSDDDTAVSKNRTYRSKLSKLECPFTWNMKDITKSIYTDYNPHDDEEPFPLLKLLRAIMAVYVETKDDGRDDDVLLEYLKKCDDYYRELKNENHPEISANVVYALLQATKCFVYLTLNMARELDLVFKNLENINNMSEKESSTLLGCKSICWSKYHRIGSQKAEQFIREAIKLNSNCDIWYYILGKNIRRQRRDSSIATVPNHEEISSFLNAYKIARHPSYGIYVAQMYRESKKFDKAQNMYNNLFDRVTFLSNTVLLRLALGFINLKQLPKAKVCLDIAEENCANHSMYLHYRGIYHMKRQEYSKAKQYFKQAIKDFNLPADKQYLECLIKTDKSYDATQHLLQLLDKYKSLPDKQLQATILDVAFSYWKRERDLKNAVKYFLKAIEIDPQAKCLTNFFNNDVFPIKDRNVYDFLEKYIFPAITQQRHRFDEATFERVKAIKEFISLYDERQLKIVGDTFNHIKINK